MPGAPVQVDATTTPGQDCTSYFALDKFIVSLSSQSLPDPQPPTHPDPGRPLNPGQGPVGEILQLNSTLLLHPNPSPNRLLVKTERSFLCFNIVLLL